MKVVLTLCFVAALQAGSGTCFATDVNLESSHGPNSDLQLQRRNDWAHMWSVTSLPNNEDFVFALYGIPKDLNKLKSYVNYLKKEELGNGFDPGPTAVPDEIPLFRYLSTIKWPFVSYPGCAYFQVWKGGCEIDPRMIPVFKEAEKHNFHAVHFGEWGSYFHDLSGDRGFFESIYGSGTEASRYIREKSLRGFDIPIRFRTQAYSEMHSYFNERKNALGGSILSVTGLSHYEAYAGEWGASAIGIELGVPAFSQSKIATARGAARNSGLAWTAQISPWLNNSVTTTGGLRNVTSTWEGEDAGHSTSFYVRMWLHSWFAGAAMVTAEGSYNNFFDSKYPNWKLSKLGRTAQDVRKLMKEVDRGVPYTPVAIVLDKYAGYNPYEKRSWAVLDGSAEDEETFVTLERTIFPGAYNIREGADPLNPEGRFLVDTPFGEIIDVIRSNYARSISTGYPVLILLGTIDFNTELVTSLRNALGSGSTVIFTGRQVAALRSLGYSIDELKRLGDARIITPVTFDAGNFSKEIRKALSEAANRYVPIQIESDGIEFQINRNTRGWIVELINNNGVVKQPNAAAQIQDAARYVRLHPKFGFSSVEVIGLDGVHKLDALELTIPAGEVRYLQFVL